MQNHILTILTVSLAVMAACSVQEKLPSVPEGVSAEALYNQYMNNPNTKRITQGEFWAWHACGGMDLFVTAYEIWQDESWVEYGCKYYDGLLGNMVKDPDGYYSTFQKVSEDKKLWTDAQVTDALLLTPMLKMSELIRNTPALRTKFKEQADRYVDYAAKHVFEKWEKRGLWHEQGEYGNYLFGNMFLDKPVGKKWVIDNTLESSLLGNKYNISNKVGKTLMVMWRITRDEKYRAMAEKLFYRLKADMQQFDGHLVWHYWAPYYPGDMRKDGVRYRFWSSIHPHRSGYKAEEVNQIVQAYHNGIVFDEEDIKAIVKTNLDIMWNGDLENPVFGTCDGKKPDTAGIGAFLKVYKTGNKKANQGALWSALAQFDPTIRQLSERKLNKGTSISDKIRKVYYDAFIRTSAPNFERKYVKKYKLPVKVKQVAGGNSPDLVMTTVLPYIIEKGKPAWIVGKSKNKENRPLEIALFSRDGAKKLKTLHTGSLAGNYDGQKGVHVTTWDGEGIEPGKYRIRWILDGKYSDRFVEVR